MMPGHGAPGHGDPVPSAPPLLLGTPPGHPGIVGRHVLTFPLTLTLTLTQTLKRCSNTNPNFNPKPSPFQALWADMVAGHPDLFPADVFNAEAC